MATIQDLGKVAYFNKGAYNSETNYEINDVVSYNGSSYVSLVNNNRGNLPTNTNFWSVVASKGDKGDTGKPFVIEKTYESIEDMVTDYDNMNVNDYVMISGDIEEQQNATLWTKTDTEVSPYKWVYLADFSGASGITGATPNIQIGNVTEGNEPSVTRRAGSTNENPILDFVLKTGATGATGATGNGISSVTKTATSGLTDTYTIAYTNGNNTTFNVNNGKGIASIAKTSTSGLVDTYTITYNDGTTSTFQITNGEDGEVTQAQLDETNREVNKYKTIYNVLPKVENDTLSSEVELSGTGEAYMKIREYGKVSQESTTGKNLFKNINFNTSNHNLTFNNINNVLNMSGTSDSTYYPSVIMYADGSYLTSDWAAVASNIKPEKGYFNNNENTIISIFQKGIKTGNQRVVVGYEDNTVEELYLFSSDFSDKTITTTKKINFISVTGYPTQTYNMTFNIMISTNGGDFEPYTGEKPSPSPDYPQQIKVVTGNNNIKIQNSDKTVEQNYPLNLGNLEMYEGDYFFKNTIDDENYDSNLDLNAWYLKNNYGIGTINITDWFYNQDATHRYAFFPKPNNSISYGKFGYDAIGEIGAIDGNGNLNNYAVIFDPNKYTDAEIIEKCNGKKYYYQLATPTYTKITDTTLIGQLEAIDSANSYKEKTYITCTSASADNEVLQVKTVALKDLNNILDQTQGE